MLPDRVLFALVAFVVFLGFADFGLAAFLLAFAFFAVAVSVVVSLIVFSLLLSASDDTFITPVPKEGEAKDGEYRAKGGKALLGESFRTREARLGKASCFFCGKPPG